MKCQYRKRIARLEDARANALEALRIHRESIRALWVSHPLPLRDEAMTDLAERGIVHRAAARELACEQITTVRSIDNTLSNVRREIRMFRIMCQPGMA